MNRQATSIVILGAGYAGIMAALRLSHRGRRYGIRVTLVNASDRFVERPRLPEVAVGKSLPERSIPHMLRGREIDFVVGRAKSIKPEQKKVVIETNTGTIEHRYDRLIVALGSRVRRDRVDGVDAYAYTADPNGPRSAAALYQQLAGMGRDQFRVAVIGGGATGIEMATEIKAAFQQAEVQLISGQKAGTFKGARVEQVFRQALAEQNIKLIEERPVVRVDAEAVYTADQTIPVDIVVWCGGFVASPLPKAAGIQVNHAHQIEVDPTLRAISHPDIYAVGDAAYPIERPGVPIRMALLPALITGAHAANNILRDLKGNAQRPLSFEWYGQAVTLGPNDAVGFNTYPADRPAGPLFRRKFALRLRNFFVKFLVTTLELERRFPGFLIWTGQWRYDRQRRRAGQPSYEFRSL